MEPTEDPADGAAREHSIEGWTGPLPTESAIVRRHRIAQGQWRSQELQWPPGEPAGKRTKARYPTLPNYLARRHGDGRDAYEAGVNLMSAAARSYTAARIEEVRALSGTAEPDRLYRNLLSSQPLAFSVAGELRAHPAATTAVLRQLTGRPVTGLARLKGADDVVPAEQRTTREYARLEQYTLDGVEAEWFPPRWAHTGDRSGFDLAACLDLAGGRRLVVSVEVKYIDTFSSKPLEWDRYQRFLQPLGLDEHATTGLVRAGCSQVLRQVMITGSLGRDGLVPGVAATGQVDEVMAVVLARENDTKARSVAHALDAAVEMPVQFWSHRDLFDAAALQPDLAPWAAQMAARYLHDPAPRGRAGGTR